MKPVYVLHRKILLFFIFLLSGAVSIGQATNDYRSAGTGNWNTLATWERYNGTTWAAPTAGEGTPDNSDGVITILNSHTITVTANVTIDQATINAGGQITVNSSRTLTIANGTGTDLTVDGTISNANTITTTGTLVFNASSLYIHNRNGGTIPTATWNASSTCIIEGVTGTVPSGLGQSFGNFTWNCTGQSSNENLNGNLTTINGDFKMVSTGTGGDVLRLTNGTDLTLDVDGGFIIEGGDLVFTNNNADVTVNVGGDFSQSGGSLDFSNDNVIGILILNVTGNFSQSAGFFDFASGSANTSRTPALNLAGNFSQTGSGIITTSTGDADIINGTITFNKSGTQTFSIATQANIEFFNIIIASGSTLELNSDITLTSNSTNTWAGSFTVNSGGILNTGTYHILSSTGASAGTNNDFILSAGATVITAEADGLQNSNTGSVSTSVSNRTYNSGADYEFRGATTGIFTTTSVANTARNIVINNTSGNVTLNQPMVVTGSFTLTAGNLITTSTNLLIINDNATASGGSYSPVRYVDGPVQKTGNDAFTFPVGKSGVYAPISISAPGTTTDAFIAEYIRSSGSALGTITASGLARVSNCEYWNLNRITGSATVNVTLSWSNQSPCNAAVYVDDLATLTVAHFNGTNWNSHGNSGGTTGNVVAGTVTWNAVSTFSPFTIGSTSSATNPLPVRFGNITANQNGADINVEWFVYSEEDISHYEIERSENGTRFHSIGRVSPANQNIVNRYSFLDATPLTGNGFYRIKSIDIDGKYLYSSIVRITIGGNNENKINIYPNPVKADNISFQLAALQKGNYVVKIIGSNGQQLYHRSFYHNGGSISQVMPLPPGIKTGMYILYLENNGMKVTGQSFIVQ
jgi:hypothetical protein